jgi:hypothetical protein
VATAQQAAAFAELSRMGCSAMDAARAVLLANQVELAEAWAHEARGKGGKWVRGNPVLHPALRPQTGHALGPETDPAVASIKDKPATLGHLARAQEQTAKIAQEAAREAAQKAATQVLAVHHNYVKETEEAETKHAKRKAWMKFFGVMSTTVAGGVAAYIESKTGVPGAAQIATAISPITAEALFELKNKL